MKRIALFPLLCVLAPFAASAQRIRYDNVAFATGGVRLPNRTVSVSATVYTNSPRTNAAANPLPVVAIGQTFNGAGVDAAVNYGLWAAPGRYTLPISSPGISPITMTVTLPCGSTATSCSLGAVSAPSLSVSGQNTFTTLSAYKARNVLVVDGTHYAFSTAGLQSAISDAITAGGGTVDARGMGSFNITSEIDVGNHAQTPVTLLLPTAANWTVSGITNGTSCALKLFSQSAIIGANTSNADMVIHAGAATNNLDSLLCTEAAPTGNGSYVRASGFILFNPNGATLANGIMNVQALFDGSEFKNITTANYGGVGLNVHGLVCCGTSFINMVSNGNHVGNSIPVQVTLSSSSGAFAFYNLSADHPGMGKNAVVISGVGNGNSVRFFNTYSEGNSSDTTTANISAGSTAGPIEFYGVTCNDNASSTAYCLDIPNSGTPNVHVYGMQQLVGGSANCLNDHFAGKTFACASGNLPLYLSNGLIFNRFQVSGATGTCSFLTGGGTSPSCSLSSGSTDTLGTVILTAGTGSPGSSGTFKITFSSSYQTSLGSRCVYTLNNGSSAWNARATVMTGVGNPGDSGTVTWDNNAVALTTSTAYYVNYFCGAL